MPTIPPVGPTAPPQAGRAATTATDRALADAARRASPASKRTEAFRQFEAFVMQSFISEMLPKNATNVFGSGTAGEVWRSMLAEKLAAEIAKSGRLGIAERVAAGAPHAAPAAPSAPAASGGWAAAVLRATETDATTSEPSGE